MIRICFIVLFVNFLAYTNAQEVIDSSIVIGEHLIYFDSDEYELKQRDIDSLHQFVFNVSDSCRFFIDAHTDQVGSNAYNLNLSKRRTTSVADAIKDFGLSDSLISSSYYGESQILRKGSTEDVNQANRRARVRAVRAQKMIFLKGTVFDKENKEGIQAKINLTTDFFESETVSDTNGLFSIISPLDREVSIEILAKDYFIEANKIRVGSRHIDLDLKIPLPKLELGKRYLFKNMLFYGNRSVMIPESESAAFHLKRFMDLNADVCILIAGHVNHPFVSDVKRTSTSFELSIARALEVRNQLLVEGVGDERMLVKGYGNWQMKYPEATSRREMQANRRVEIGILSCEKMRKVENDELVDLERYRYEIIDRTFDRRLMYTDFASVNNENKILKQVEKMEAELMVPEKYTYKEILDAYPELPEKK